jgi:pyruvate ferredoxin oxidoreductase delta subunit
MKNRLGGVCEPGGSKKLETGKWRSITPIVTLDSCNKCGICYRFCPDSCISITEQGAQINLFYCKGCLICMHECPVRAIEVEEKP